jgi:hypothetical protein
MNELTRALFEAHVAHELHAAQQAEFETRIAPLTEQVFDWLAQVKLDDLLTSERVLGVIERYVIDLRISGGITELAGQLSQTVFSSETSTQTRVDQLLSDESFREYADKIESLPDAYREVVRLVTETPSFRALLTRGLTVATVNFLLPSAGHDDTAGRGMLAGLRRELGLELSHQLEERLSGYLERHAERLVRVSADHLRDMVTTEALRSIADDLWKSIGPMRLSALFSFLSVADVEDFWIVSYETWLKFRKTPFFRATCAQIVEAIFAKYGGESVLLLLEDMGVSQTMVIDELRTLFGPVLAHARQTGLRELQVRQRLALFYESEPVALLLARGDV